MSRLVVISGPIASGKSTLAHALAALLRRDAIPVAVIDLDLIYEMFGEGPKSDEGLWSLARSTAARFARSILETGGHAIVEGEFWNEEERQPFAVCGVQPSFVTLTIDFEDALRRAQDDPTRRASKNRAFLAEQHRRFEAKFRPPDGPALTLSASASPVDDLVQDVLDWIDRPARSHN